RDAVGDAPGERGIVATEVMPAPGRDHLGGIAEPRTGAARLIAAVEALDQPRIDPGELRLAVQGGLARPGAEPSRYADLEIGAAAIAKRRDRADRTAQRARQPVEGEGHHTRPEGIADQRDPRRPPAHAIRGKDPGEVASKDLGSLGPPE